MAYCVIIAYFLTLQSIQTLFIHQFSFENLNINALQCIFVLHNNTVYCSYISSGNIRPAVDFDDFRDSWLHMGVALFAVTRANLY